MGPYARYGMAKLASLILAEEIDRRSHKEGVLSTAVHPGVVATELLRRDNFEAMLGPQLGPLAMALASFRNRIFAYSAETAALTVLHCATSTALHGGELFVPIATRWEPKHLKSGDPAFAHNLWTFSEALVKDALS